MINDRVVLENTADGSSTLFVPALNEHYHSVNGAVQEAKHVYIDAGFNHCAKSEVHLFEVGFGTGLNAFMTLLEAEKMVKKVVYHAIELYPLPVEISHLLNYPEQVSPQRKKEFDALHMAAWGDEVAITPSFLLKKVQCDLRHYKLDKMYDVIYYDAFAPEKQPEMWDTTLFEKLFLNTNNGGILTTYCAKGVVRRSMQAVGFDMERLLGPPGKRQMLRAIRKDK